MFHVILTKAKGDNIDVQIKCDFRKNELATEKLSLLWEEQRLCIFHMAGSR